MQVIAEHQTLSLRLAEQKRSGKTVALVPTMGNLHNGHLTLVKKAKQKADIVVVSIFVNPLQFGANEDLDKYPKTLQQDQQKLQALGVDFLFTPSAQSIYPHGLAQHSQVQVPELGAFHCGASRPGHFNGVSTVVTILFNICQPDIAVFGEKDFQQLAIIRKMTADLCLPITIESVCTERDVDGLALSSRNQYLDNAQRALAPKLYAVLQQAKKAIIAQQSIANVHQQSIDTLQEYGFDIDYFNIANASTLAPADHTDKSLVLLAAVKLGQTRLIDNISFSLNP